MIDKGGAKDLHPTSANKMRQDILPLVSYMMYPAPLSQNKVDKKKVMCKTILSVQWDTLSKADKVMIFLNPFKGSKVSHFVRCNEKKSNLKKYL